MLHDNGVFLFFKKLIFSLIREYVNKCTGFYTFKNAVTGKKENERLQRFFFNPGFRM
jgi:hypothetical protein